MYGTSADQILNGTGRETFDAVRLMQSIQKTPYVPANGARYPNGPLGQRLLQIARIIKANVGLEVAFTTSAAGTHTLTKSARSRLLVSFPTCFANLATRWPRSHKTWATEWRT